MASWMRMVRVSLAAVCAGVLAVTSGTIAEASPSRGEVLDVVRVQALDAAALRNRLGETGFDATGARFGADAYRVRYRTLGVSGAPTVASGLVVLPRNGHRVLRTVSYTHGTRTGRADVASLEPSNMDRGAALLIASRGYAAVAPDYLGLGLGAGLHPYMDAASEASASLDMLDAARAVAAGRHRILRRSVFVTGFSQGGHAAMALGRALQSRQGPWRLGALAPISGPLDAEHAEIPGALGSGEVAPAAAAFYLAYWTVAMNRIHHFYSEPSEVFRPPFDRTVEALFDGSHSEDEIFPALPPTPQDLFTTAYLNRLLHPTGGVRKALRDNDDTCTSWRPRAPVHLFAAHGDTQVTITNSRHCQRSLRRSGADAPLTDLGPLEHFDTLYQGLPRVLDWYARR
ncbi:hypothetical protein [Sciscionella marina]|uniref:hypothetical protein n=1 Tax=Sciscionella marina TaxID=508770 RepID=UPI00058F7C06|nr:hypothetical protein [Sciscionella marina]